jgi:hypothetical protein
MPARAFANESSAFVGLFVRMVLPIAAYAVYYIAMYEVRTAAATAAYYGESAVLWSVQLGVLSSMLGASFRNMYLFQEPRWNALFTARAHDQVDQLFSVAQDLVYGSKARHLQSLVATSPSTYELMLVNGCVPSPISAAACAAYGPNPYYGCNNYYPYSRCYISSSNTLLSPVVFNYGIVSRGLFGAILDYVQRVREAIAAQEQEIARGPSFITYKSVNNLSPLGVGPISTGQLVNEMASVYLAAGLQTLATNVEAEVVTRVQASVNTDTLAVAFSCLSLPLFVLLFYRPLINHLDADIKRSRALLMLVPDEIAKVVPAIVDVGQKLMANTD